MTATPIRVIKTAEPANCCSGDCSQGRACPKRKPGKFNVGLAGAIFANVMVWIGVIALVSVVLTATQ